MLSVCKAKKMLPRSLKAAPFAYLGASKQRLAQNNTFGVLVTSALSEAEWQITSHVNQTPSATEWQRQARAKQRAAAQTGFDDALAAHTARWAERWSRSCRPHDCC